MTHDGRVLKVLLRCCLDHPPMAIPGLVKQEITPHYLFWEGTGVHHSRHFTFGNSVSAVSDPRVKFLDYCSTKSR
jgi:hypothetical protein